MSLFGLKEYLFYRFINLGDYGDFYVEVSFFKEPEFWEFKGCKYLLKLCFLDEPKGIGLWTGESFTWVWKFEL